MADAWAETALADPSSRDAPHDLKVIETLRALLKRDISPQSAAEALAAAYEAPIRSGKTSTAGIWCIYCWAVADLGADDAALELLVQTLLCVGALPDVVDVASGQPVTESGAVFWREVPDFAFWMMESIACPVDTRRPEKTPERLQKALNAARFGARYLRALDADPKQRAFAPQDAGPRRGMRSVALGALLHALRCEFSTAPDAGDAVKVAPVTVPQAAEWIRTAGRSLRLAAREGFSSGIDCDMDWDLFRARFEQLAALEVVDAELRRIAGEATEEMRRIEQEEEKKKKGEEA